MSENADRKRLMDLTASEVRADIGRHNVSDAEVARRIDMAPGQLSRYLSGEREIPLLTLVRIADAIDADPGSIIERALSAFLDEQSRQHQ